MLNGYNQAIYESDHSRDGSTGKPEPTGWGYPQSQSYYNPPQPDRLPSHGAPQVPWQRKPSYPNLPPQCTCLQCQQRSWYAKEPDPTPHQMMLLGSSTTPGNGNYPVENFPRMDPYYRGSTHPNKTFPENASPACSYPMPINGGYRPRFSAPKQVPGADFTSYERTPDPYMRMYENPNFMRKPPERPDQRSKYWENPGNGYFPPQQYQYPSSCRYPPYNAPYYPQGVPPGQPYQPSQIPSQVSNNPQPYYGIVPNPMRSIDAHPHLQSQFLKQDSKISPLRLMRKKKMEDSPGPHTSPPRVCQSEGAPALDVRRFLSTWADEDDDSPPVPQMVVLDCQEINEEQAELLRFYEESTAVRYVQESIPGAPSQQATEILQPQASVPEKPVVPTPIPASETAVSPEPTVITSVSDSIIQGQTTPGDVQLEEIKAPSPQLPAPCPSSPTTLIESLPVLDLPTSEYRNNKFLDLDAQLPVKPVTNENLAVDETLPISPSPPLSASIPKEKKGKKRGRKPTIKFSIQKSHDLKISLRVMNDSKENDEGRAKEDNEADAGQTGEDRITFSVEGDADDVHLRQLEPKLRAKKAKRRRVLQQSYSVSSEEQVSHSVADDFQVQKCVESAKIKLTFKRRRTEDCDINLKTRNATDSGENSSDWIEESISSSTVTSTTGQPQPQLNTPSNSNTSSPKITSSCHITSPRSTTDSIETQLRAIWSGEDGLQDSTPVVDFYTEHIPTELPGDDQKTSILQDILTDCQPDKEPRMGVICHGLQYIQSTPMFPTTSNETSNPPVNSIVPETPVSLDLNLKDNRIEDANPVIDHLSPIESLTNIATNSPAVVNEILVDNLFEVAEPFSSHQYIPGEIRSERNDNNTVSTTPVHVDSLNEGSLRCDFGPSYESSASDIRDQVPNQIEFSPSHGSSDSGIRDQVPNEIVGDTPMPSTLPPLLETSMHGKTESPISNLPEKTAASPIENDNIEEGAIPSNLRLPEKFPPPSPIHGSSFSEDSSSLKNSLKRSGGESTKCSDQSAPQPQSNLENVPPTPDTNCPVLSEISVEHGDLVSHLEKERPQPRRGPRTPDYSPPNNLFDSPLSEDDRFQNHYREYSSYSTFNIDTKVESVEKGVDENEHGKRISTPKSPCSISPLASRESQILLYGNGPASEIPDNDPYSTAEDGLVVISPVQKSCYEIGTICNELVSDVVPSLNLETDSEEKLQQVNEETLIENEIIRDVKLKPFADNCEVDSKKIVEDLVGNVEMMEEDEKTGSNEAPAEVHTVIDEGKEECGMRKVTGEGSSTCVGEDMDVEITMKENSTAGKLENIEVSGDALRTELNHPMTDTGNDAAMIVENGHHNEMVMNDSGFEEVTEYKSSGSDVFEGNNEEHEAPKKISEFFGEENVERGCISDSEAQNNCGIEVKRGESIHSTGEPVKSIHSIQINAETIETFGQSNHSNASPMKCEHSCELSTDDGEKLCISSIDDGESGEERHAPKEISDEKLGKEDVHEKNSNQERSSMNSTLAVEIDTNEEPLNLVKYPLLMVENMECDDGIPIDVDNEERLSCFGNVVKETELISGNELEETVKQMSAGEILPSEEGNYSTEAKDGKACHNVSVDHSMVEETSDDNLMDMDVDSSGEDAPIKQSDQILEEGGFCEENPVVEIGPSSSDIMENVELDGSLSADGCEEEFILVSEDGELVEEGVFLEVVIPESENVDSQENNEIDDISEELSRQIEVSDIPLPPGEAPKQNCFDIIQWLKKIKHLEERSDSPFTSESLDLYRNPSPPCTPRLVQSPVPISDVVTYSEQEGECKDDGTLLTPDDGVDVNAVPDDAHFQDVMESCLENAERFLARESPDMDLMSSKDVLLASYEAPSDIDNSSCHTPIQSPFHCGIAPEQLPVDNWPYLEEEIPLSPQWRGVEEEVPLQDEYSPFRPLEEDVDDPRLPRFLCTERSRAELNVLLGKASPEIVNKAPSSGNEAEMTNVGETLQPADFLSDRWQPKVVLSPLPKVQACPSGPQHGCDSKVKCEVVPTPLTEVDEPPKEKSPPPSKGKKKSDDTRKMTFLEKLALKKGTRRVENQAQAGCEKKKIPGSHRRNSVEKSSKPDASSSKSSKSTNTAEVRKPIVQLVEFLSSCSNLSRPKIVPSQNKPNRSQRHSSSADNRCEESSQCLLSSSRKRRSSAGPNLDNNRRRLKSAGDLEEVRSALNVPKDVVIPVKKQVKVADPLTPSAAERLSSRNDVSSLNKKDRSKSDVSSANAHVEKLSSSVKKALAPQSSSQNKKSEVSGLCSPPQAKTVVSGEKSGSPPSQPSSKLKNAHIPSTHSAKRVKSSLDAHKHSTVATDKSNNMGSSEKSVRGSTQVAIPVKMLEKKEEHGGSTGKPSDPRRRSRHRTHAPTKTSSSGLPKIAKESQELSKPRENDKAESYIKDEKPWRCSVCGFDDAALQQIHIQEHAFHCRSCHLAFKTEAFFIEHLTEKHSDIRKMHHCLLCELSFQTKEQHDSHLQTREHRHLEGVEKSTISTLFSLLIGESCPVLGMVEPRPEWLPNQSGTVHFYHQATPLSLAVQYWKMKQSGAQSTQ